MPFALRQQRRHPVRRLVPPSLPLPLIVAVLALQTASSPVIAQSARVRRAGGGERGGPARHRLVPRVSNSIKLPPRPARGHDAPKLGVISRAVPRGGPNVAGRGVAVRSIALRNHSAGHGDVGNATELGENNTIPINTDNMTPQRPNATMNGSTDLLVGGNQTVPDETGTTTTVMVSGTVEVKLGDAVMSMSGVDMRVTVVTQEDVLDESTMGGGVTMPADNDTTEYDDSFDGPLHSDGSVGLDGSSGFDNDDDDDDFVDETFAFACPAAMTNAQDERTAQIVSTLTRLEKVTGATITVTMLSGTCACTVSGTSEQVSRASEAVKQIVGGA